MIIFLGRIFKIITNTYKYIIMNPLCGNPKHPLSALFFCKVCLDSKNLQSAMYCQECHPEKKTKHFHTKMTPDAFKKIYSSFKSQIFPHAVKFFMEQYNQNNSPMKAQEYKKLFNQKVQKSRCVFKNALISGEFDFKAEFQDEKYRQWLVNNKFHLAKPWDNSGIREQIQKVISKIINGGGTGSSILEGPNPYIWPMNIKTTQSPQKSAAASPVEYEEQMKILRSKVVELRKEKQLGQLFAKLTSYYTDKQIEKGLEEITNLEGEYHPNLFLFTLAKLKTSELHSNSPKIMQEYLKQIAPEKPKELELHHYFSAISQWVPVYDPEEQDQQTKLFLQTRNNTHYKLSNPQKYIDSLTKAIKLNPKPLYHACRAIGYMISDKPELAQKDFAEADKAHFKNDAMLNNRNYNAILRKKEIDSTLFRQSLSERSTQLIVNMCRHLAQKKAFQEMKLCCEELVTREPKNIAFHLQKFNTFFKLRDKDNASDELSEIKHLNVLQDDEIEECQRKIQLLKAKQNEQTQNYEESQEKFKRVAEMGEPSATHWYNYATFLFNHRDTNENNEQALKAINKALQIKQKSKFYQLKYLLLFVSGNMEEAKALHGRLGQDEEKFHLMKEHLNDNL